jgi:S1-C subfamily serine protease
MHIDLLVQDWLVPWGGVGVVLIVVALMALGVAVFSVPAGSAPDPSGSVARLEAVVGQGLVDVVATLGDQGEVAMGTGMVLTPEGRVLTNYHVLMGAISIMVTDVGDQCTYTASVTGYDVTHDIAVLQLAGARGLRTVPLGDSAALRTGEQVTVLGNAGEPGRAPSAVSGTVTGLNQSITADDEAAVFSERHRHPDRRR